MLPLSRVSFGAIDAYRFDEFSDGGLLHNKFMVSVDNKVTPDFDTFRAILDPQYTVPRRPTEGKLIILSHRDYPDRVTINGQTELSAKAEELVGNLAIQSGNTELQQVMIQRAVARLSDPNRMTPANLLAILTTKLTQFAPKA